MTTEISSENSGHKQAIVVHKKAKTNACIEQGRDVPKEVQDKTQEAAPIKRKLVLKGFSKREAKRIVVKKQNATGDSQNITSDGTPRALSNQSAARTQSASAPIDNSTPKESVNINKAKTADSLTNGAQGALQPSTSSARHKDQAPLARVVPNNASVSGIERSRNDTNVASFPNRSIDKSNKDSAPYKNPVQNNFHKDANTPRDKDGDSLQNDGSGNKALDDNKKSADSGAVDITTQKSFASINDRAASFYEVPNNRPNVRAGNLARGSSGFDRHNARYNDRNGGRPPYDRQGDDGRTTRFGDSSRGAFNRNNGGSGNRAFGSAPYQQKRFDNNRSQGNFDTQRRYSTYGGYNSQSGGARSSFSGAQARANYQKDRAGGATGGQRTQGGFGARRSPFGAGGARSSFGPNGPRGFRPGFGAPKATASTLQNRPSTKRTFNKNKKQVYDKHDEEYYDESFFENKKKAAAAAAVPSTIEIMETVSISDLAKKMNLKASDIIAKLMTMGTMVTITQSIDSDTATLLAAEYGCQVKLVSLYDETTVESDKGDENSIKSRPPVVTVMGHVDHGKTKTLDAIRHTHIAEGEAGGITQSIGAYTVDTPKGAITFLDTPGHEAFTLMRARGAQVTDIVVLVVAADDGVMPQTLEAIAHAKDAKVPIIVAVNKCDKPDANPEKVMTQLSEHDLTPEAWGGSTQYVQISALKKQGLDNLLDAILLQAEMLELKATYECRAQGKILESRIDQGRGVVSSVIIQRGTLRQGDPFVAGVYAGRVRAMFDDKGKRVKEATPSIPVEVLGMEEMPNAGDPFAVTANEKEARAISTKRQELKRFEVARAVKKVTLENLYTSIEDAEVKEFKVIIKADLQGSAEALKLSLEKLSTKDLRLVVIHSSAGAINESDVTLAAADSNAIIIGFNVRPTPKAKQLAEQEKVEIRKYNIIYKCVEEIQAAMEGMLAPDTKENVTGSCEVRNVYKIPKVGCVAGCVVSDGVVRRTSCVNLIRDGIVKYTGKIASLKHFKDDVKEMTSGQECGLTLENWQDIEVGDHLEIFEYVEVARKLGDELQDARAENERKVAEGVKQAQDADSTETK